MMHENNEYPGWQNPPAARFCMLLHLLNCGSYRSNTTATFAAATRLFSHFSTTALDARHCYCYCCIVFAIRAQQSTILFPKRPFFSFTSPNA